MKPYYEDGYVTIYHGDAREILPMLAPPDFLVTDPPYGIAYKSNSPRVTLADSIQGDEDTTLRDFALDWWGDGPALVFGTWRIPRPVAAHTLLIWDTKGALGMGDTSMPWKPSHQEIYVLGKGFVGHRGTDVLAYAPVQSMAYNGRLHPHQKPVGLMRDLILKCPGRVVDPFCGSGTTLRAAKDLGRGAIGIEIEEEFCEIAAERCAQEVLGIAS